MTQAKKSNAEKISSERFYGLPAERTQVIGKLMHRTRVQSGDYRRLFRHPNHEPELV